MPSLHILLFSSKLWWHLFISQAQPPPSLLFVGDRRQNSCPTSSRLLLARRYMCALDRTGALFLPLSFFKFLFPFFRGRVQFFPSPVALLTESRNLYSLPFFSSQYDAKMRARRGAIPAEDRTSLSYASDLRESPPLALRAQSAHFFLFHEFIFRERRFPPVRKRSPISVCPPPVYSHVFCKTLDGPALAHIQRFCLLARLTLYSLICPPRMARHSSHRDSSFLPPDYPVQLSQLPRPPPPCVDSQNVSRKCVAETMRHFGPLFFRRPFERTSLPSQVLQGRGRPVLDSPFGLWPRLRLPSIMSTIHIICVTPPR